MGYTLLDTLGELWFTQFFNSVLLCTCLLVSRVSFLFFNCFCLGEKAEWFSFWFLLLLLGKSRGFVSVFLYYVFPVP